MARLNPSLVGGVSGRVGNLVVCHRMGGYYVRRYVEHLHDARSEGQLRQRGVFRTMMGLSSDMQELLVRSMRRSAKELGLLPSNLFMRLNACCCGSTAEGETAVDYSQLVVAAGPVAVPDELSATLDGQRLEVRFSRRSPGANCFDGDRVQVYVFCPDVRDGVLSLPVHRYNRRLAFVLPDEMAGHEVHVYAYCSGHEDDTLVSYSVYGGCFVAGEAAAPDGADAPDATGDATAGSTDNAVRAGSAEGADGLGASASRGEARKHGNIGAVG